MKTETLSFPIPQVVFGVPLHDVTFEEAVQWAVEKARAGKPVRIATANLDFVMRAHRDPDFHRMLLDSDLVIADGQPLVTASRWFGPGLRERVTGSDLTPLLADAARKHGLSVFNLGGGDGVAETVGEVLAKRFPGLKVAGHYAPPIAPVHAMDHAGIAAKLEAAGPDFLFVAFGAPKQEQFIDHHIETWNVPVAMGVGGTLDFLAGRQCRAPQWVQRLHLEWLWRLGTNPRRLAGRYGANLGFLARMSFASAWCRLRAALCPRPRPAAFSDHSTLARLQLPRIRAPWHARSLLRCWTDIVASRDLVVHLGQARWLNGLELGILLALRKLGHSRGHRICLWDPDPAILRQLRCWRLDTAFLCLHAGRGTGKPPGGPEYSFSKAQRITLPAKKEAQAA